MMGCQSAPAQLFYDFCLDYHVSADHLLREIDRHLAPKRAQRAIASANRSMTIFTTMEWGFRR